MRLQLRPVRYDWSIIGTHLVPMMVSKRFRYELCVCVCVCFMVSLQCANLILIFLLSGGGGHGSKVFANQNRAEICNHVSWPLKHMPENSAVVKRWGNEFLPILLIWLSSFCNRQQRAEPGTTDLDFVLREIYVLYADCALKDPFYELEMPIRCELFTNAVDTLIRRVEKKR